MTSFFTIYRSVCIGLLSLLFTVQVSADAQQTASQLVSASGFISLSKQLPQHFNRGIQDAVDYQKAPESQQQQLLAQAQQAITIANIHHHVEQTLTQSLSASDITALMQWYNSPTGQKISAAQSYAASEAGFEAMMLHVNTLLSEEALLQLAALMDQQLGFVEFIVDLQEYQAFAEYSSQQALKHQPVDLTYFGNQMKQQRDPMRFNAEQLAVISLAYAFRDISREEIRAYEHFLQQPLTQLFLKAAMRGLEKGMQETQQHWLGSITRLQMVSE